MTATFPVTTVEEYEPHGVKCMDCERDLPVGYPYSTRLSGFAVDEPVSDVVCVYCASPA